MGVDNLGDAAVRGIQTCGGGGRITTHPTALAAWMQFEDEMGTTNVNIRGES